MDASNVTNEEIAGEENEVEIGEEGTSGSRVEVVGGGGVRTRFTETSGSSADVIGGSEVRT